MKSKNTLIAILAFLTILFGAFCAFKFFMFSRQLVQNWAEIKFAYEKPLFVKAIRSELEIRQKDMEKTFLEETRKPEDKLLEELLLQLRGENLND